MIIKKRQLLLATLVLALAAAVFVNWYYARPDVEAAKTSSSTSARTEPRANLGDARYVVSNDAKFEGDADDSKTSEFFAGAKLRRKTARDEAEESFNGIIKDKDSSPEAIAKASESLDKLIKDSELECDIENLVTAKTGRENVVILNGDAAEIIVGGGALDDVAVIQIKEIAVKHSGRSADDVNIIEMES